MSNYKISELTAASALTGTEQVEVTQSGGSFRTTTQAIADLGGGASTFDAIGSGTNTSAAMVVGTGASLAASGSGTIAATSCTGNSATVTTNANLTGPITSVGNATSIASQTGTGTKFVVDTGPTLVTPNIGTATGTGLVLTSTSATALAVGATSDYALQVDDSTASSATGIKIKSAAAGGGVAITAISSAANEALSIASKGTSNLTVTGANAIFLSGGGTQHNMTATQVSEQVAFRGFGSVTAYVWYNPGSVQSTASTETITVDYQLGLGAMQYATGAKTTQRDFRIRPATNTAVAASTITDAVTVSIEGAPLASTNITQTNAFAFQIEAGAVGGSTTNSFGFRFKNQTGATNNYLGTMDAGVIQQPPIAIGSLIAAGTAGAGARSIVSDALAPVFGATVAAGGAVVVPVYSDGTNWKVG